MTAWEADTVPFMFLSFLIGFSPFSLMEVEVPWRDRKTMYFFFVHSHFAFKTVPETNTTIVN